MEKVTITENLFNIIGPYLPEDINTGDISEDKHLINDLRINSAHIVDIVLDIEEKFDIMVEDDIIGEMNTVKDALNIISKKVASN